MYTLLNREFKKNSWTYKENYILVIVLSLSCLIIFGVIKEWDFTNLERRHYGYIIGGVILICLVVPFYMCLRSGNIKMLGKNGPITEPFIKKRFDEDKKILKKILIELNMYTKDKILKSITHYQTLIPGNARSNWGLSSFLTIVVAMISFVFDPFEDVEMRTTLFFQIMLFFVVIFVVVKFISWLNFGLYNNLFKRIEELLSAIYFDEFSDNLDTIKNAETVISDVGDHGYVRRNENQKKTLILKLLTSRSYTQDEINVKLGYVFNSKALDGVLNDLVSKNYIATISCKNADAGQFEYCLLK